MKEDKPKLTPNFAWQGFSCNVMNMTMGKTDFVKAHKGKLAVDAGTVYDKLKAHKDAYEKQEKPEAESAK